METVGAKHENLMPTIPDDIIHYDILTRVPVESLLRFKCVSKNWYSLLKSSDFNLMLQKRTLESHNSTDFIIVCYDQSQHDLVVCTYIDASRPYIRRDVVIKIDQFNTKYCQIVGSCNGLICLWSHFSGLALCNPSTREYRRLSDSPRVKAKTIGTRYGFGRDCISHRYKIFNITRVFSDNMQCNSMAYVYNTSTNSWRNLGVVFPTLVSVNQNGVVVNNKLHRSYTNSREIKILTCDLHTEEFEFESLQFPSTRVEGSVTKLMVSDGLLYVMLGKGPIYPDSIWVMKESYQFLQFSSILIAPVIIPSLFRSFKRYWRFHGGGYGLS
ncbi:hypothetical protein RND81_07G088200 [Saponaria officinalis]|uniref:F-box domain-containing protein n=1 Tax=Saponaria officinalis TaxID=3572 RepID=A0AAW1JNA9_SAPOF